VPCFEIEGCGLTLAALTILPVEAAGMAELVGWFMREDSGKIRS
jgi:hypothetical protein